MNGAHTSKILFLRAGYGKPDSRCEKEIYSLSKKHEAELFGWDRSADCSGVKQSKVKINDKYFLYHHVGISAPVGLGFKKMFFPLLRFWVKEWKFLLKNKDNYDAIHACDFDAAFPLLFLKRKPSVVYDIFDYYADSHNGPRVVKNIIRKLENSIIRESDSVIICSEERIKQIYPECPQRLTVIHNSPSWSMLDGDRHDYKLSNAVSKIVYVGVLSRDRFLEEITEAIIGRSEVELHIGGFGVLDGYFSEMSKKYPNIIYYGMMAYQDALALEQQCDIMMAIYDPRTPNHKYAAPNKFYEALMLKKPLIMVRDTGMDRYVETYQLGEVIDGGAESFKEGFSRALDQLIAKKEQWAEMGERGFKLYQKQFSWDEMEKRLLKIYDDFESRQQFEK